MSEHIHLMKCLVSLSDEKLNVLLELPDFSFKQGTVVANDTAFYPYRRVYMVSEESGDYTEVGWVLNSSMSHCMICANDFTFWNRRHHCRACGNLVCSNCSPFGARIMELPLSGKHRVCKECVMHHSIDNKIAIEGFDFGGNCNDGDDENANNDDSDGHGHGKGKSLQVADNVHRAIIQDVVLYDGTKIATIENTDGKDEKDHATLVCSSSSSQFMDEKRDVILSIDKPTGDGTNYTKDGSEETKDAGDGESMIMEEHKSVREGTDVNECVGATLPLKIKLLDPDMYSASQESPEVIRAREKAAKERQNLKELINAVETETVRAKTAFDERKKMKNNLISEVGVADDALRSFQSSSISSFSAIQSSSSSSQPNNRQPSPLDFPGSSLPPATSTVFNKNEGSDPSSPDSDNSVSNRDGVASRKERSSRITMTNEEEIEKTKEEKRLAEIVAVITRRRIAEEKKKNSRK